MRPGVGNAAKGLGGRPSDHRISPENDRIDKTLSLDKAQRLSNLEKAYWLLINRGQMEQLHKINSSSSRFRFRNERLRPRKQVCNLDLGKACVQSGLLQA
jgi:hypothetical protein